MNGGGDRDRLRRGRPALHSVPNPLPRREGTAILPLNLEQHPNLSVRLYETIRNSQIGHYEGGGATAETLGRDVLHGHGRSSFLLLSMCFYRVTLVVAHMGWVDLDLDFPSSCPPPQPVLPNSHLPKRKVAVSGTSKSKSTQPM